MSAGRKAAYGDFQTPLALARQVCARLRRHRLRPATVLEPTCGRGSFLVAAGEAFPGAALRGRDIDAAHLQAARAALREHGLRAELRAADFFRTDWARLLRRQPGPVLVLGNPPWVTSAALTVLGVDNLPPKSNVAGHRGLAARTGKSNFDIAEHILLRLLEAGQGRALTVAMLVKTSTARRVLELTARRGLGLERVWLRQIDARTAFGVAVDAGLLCASTRRGAPLRCRVFTSLAATEARAELGIREGSLVADLGAYERVMPILGQADPPWRSGVKHDCARVLELVPSAGGGLRNGLGERVEVEDKVLYPLLKSSDLRGDDRPAPRRWLLLPQRSLADDPARLARQAPRAWAYLQAHADALDARRSSIYRARPRFSVFGVGAYSFAPWKVAISGLYKRAAFTLVGPHKRRSPLVDDTCYFLGFSTRREADRALVLLRSEPAQAVLRALTFWDAKRPITKEILDRLELERLAAAGDAAAPSSPSPGPRRLG